ncbi:hypothetical protein BHE74_00010123 [Ensete ventricosum]|nr:hypothetical protein BHE74_00010123 [Ensete ventricosum]
MSVAHAALEENKKKKKKKERTLNLIKTDLLSSELRLRKWHGSLGHPQRHPTPASTKLLAGSASMRPRREAAASAPGVRGVAVFFFDQIGCQATHHSLVPDYQSPPTKAFTDHHTTIAVGIDGMRI